MASTVGIILGFIAGGSITYLVLAFVRRQPDEYFFRNLKSEQEFWIESRGYVLKEKWVIVKERLLYKQFPLMGWAETERRIDQTVDPIAIEVLVRSMSNLISETTIPFPLRAIVRHLPQREEGLVTGAGKAGKI